MVQEGCEREDGRKGRKLLVFAIICGVRRVLFVELFVSDKELPVCLRFVPGLSFSVSCRFRVCIAAHSARSHTETHSFRLPRDRAARSGISSLAVKAREKYTHTGMATRARGRELFTDYSETSSRLSRLRSIFRYFSQRFFTVSFFRPTRTTLPCSNFFARKFLRIDRIVNCQRQERERPTIEKLLLDTHTPEVFFNIFFQRLLTLSFVAPP